MIESIFEIILFFISILPSLLIVRVSILIVNQAKSRYGAKGRRYREELGFTIIFAGGILSFSVPIFFNLWLRKCGVDDSFTETFIEWVAWYTILRGSYRIGTKIIDEGGNKDGTEDCRIIN